MTKLDRKTIYTTAGLFIFIFISTNVFSSRLSGGGIEDIDRYRFLIILFYEIRDWDLINYLLGSKPITPLSQASCNSLSYYESLFSHSGDGSCYSVILHSYIMRTFFDHGILGIAFHLAFLWYVLGAAKYTHRERICITGVILASGTSVSSLNSIYTVLALAIAVAINRDSNNRSTYPSPSP